MTPEIEIKYSFSQTSDIEKPLLILQNYFLKKLQEQGVDKAGKRSDPTLKARFYTYYDTPNHDILYNNATLRQIFGIGNNFAKPFRIQYKEGSMRDREESDGINVQNRLTPDDVVQELDEHDKANNISHSKLELAQRYQGVTAVLYAHSVHLKWSLKSVLGPSVAKKTEAKLDLFYVNDTPHSFLELELEMKPSKENPVSHEKGRSILADFIYPVVTELGLVECGVQKYTHSAYLKGIPEMVARIPEEARLELDALYRKCS